MQTALSISAIIPAYNGEKYVARAIRSVLNQTRPVDEIIVVDDGSTDGTADAVRAFGGKVKLIQQPNAGVSAARNTAIRAAKGDWIAFLDADDEWLPEKIERQTQNLIENPDLAWTISNYYECLCDGNPYAPQYSPQKIIKLLNGKTYFESYFRAWQHRLWGCSDVQVVRRDVLIDAGLFPVGMPIGEDIDTWLRVAYLHPKVGFIEKPLAIYHLGVPQSGLQRNRNTQNTVDFIIRHFELSRRHGKEKEFKSVAASTICLWIRGMLFESRKDEIRLLLKQFSHILSPFHRTAFYMLTVFPRPTAFCLHLISKMIRRLKLNRRLKRPPQKSI